MALIRGFIAFNRLRHQKADCRKQTQVRLLDPHRPMLVLSSWRRDTLRRDSHIAKGWCFMKRAPRKKNGILILVVEDDQDHRESLTHLLELEGYEVNSANDGLHAIERLRWGMRPQAILLDMRMHVM